MTLANRITIGRLVLVPIFIVLVMTYERHMPFVRIAALGVFVIAALSDALDGFVARAYNQKTKLGAVLDPLADKLMLNLAFVFLAVNHEFAIQVPAWLPVVILSRDAIIVIGSYLINEFYGPIRVRPRLLGKITTAFQMVSIVTVLLEIDVAWYFLMGTLLVTVVSFFDYLFAGIRQVGNEDRI